MPADRGQDRDVSLRLDELVERLVVAVTDERIDENERVLGGVGDAADVLIPVRGIVHLLRRLPIRMRCRPAPQARCDLLQVHCAERR